jgi:hypothetical protein
VSWNPDTPIGFSPCGTAFGAIRRAYVAKANFFADDGPAATNRIKWYVVPDDTPVYDDWTCFWPRVDVPPDQALPQFENEGHGRDVRRFYAGNDIYGYKKDHVDGDREDFLGESLRAKYFVEGEPDPVQPCDGTGVFARFRFRNRDGLVATKSRFRFHAEIVHVGFPRNCYYLCVNSALHQFAQGPHIPIFDGATKLTLMFFARRAAPFAKLSCGQNGASLSSFVSVDFWNDGLVYATIANGSGLCFGSAGGCNDTLVHHVAMVYDGSLATNADRIKVYIDGALQTLSFSGSAFGPMPISVFAFQVGSRPFDGSYSSGDFDDVAIFPSALSGALINAIAHRSSDPSLHSPALLLRFEEGEGTIAHDSSGNGYDFTLVNGAGFCGTVCLPRSAARFRFHASVRHRVGPITTSPGRFRFRGLVVHVTPTPRPTKGRFRFRGRVIHVTPTPRAIKGRFRFRGLVIDAMPVIDTFPGKFRFHDAVNDHPDDHGISVSRFRFKGEVKHVVDPGTPIEAKFAFRSALWERTIEPSGQSIRFVRDDSQWQKFDEAFVGEAGALTVLFWARTPNTGFGGIVSIGGYLDTYFDVIVGHEVNIGMTCKMTRVVDDVTLTCEYNGDAPGSHGWHHYAVTYRQGDVGERNVMKFYFDGKLRDFFSTSDATPFAFQGELEPTHIGKSHAGEFSNSWMDDVAIVVGELEDFEIFSVANADVSVTYFANGMLFRYEIDEDPFAFEGWRGDLFDGFVNAPSHSSNVPPLLT